MRLRLVREPFDHPDYIFELKHDGFRAIAYLQHGESKLVSRNQRNLGFEALKRLLAKLPIENAILDGEVICVDAKGVSQFNQLLSRKGEPVLYAFDLLWLDGEGLRQMPLIERKKRLARLVRAAKCPRLLYAQHIMQTGCSLRRSWLIDGGKAMEAKQLGPNPSGLCMCGCGRKTKIVAKSNPRSCSGHLQQIIRAVPRASGASMNS